MPIDASIPLQVATPKMNLAEIMLQAERYKGLKAERERAASDYERKENARKTLADLILGQTPNAPGNVTMTDYEQDVTNPLPPFMTPGFNPAANVQPEDAMASGTASPNKAAMGRGAWEQYVRYDPQGAIDFRTTTQEWDKGQFDHARNLNEGVLQILGGVYDQPSYERGKNKARALYGRFGVKLEDFQLPDEYSPDLIHSLQMEAMDTKAQLDAVRRERRLEWDIEDDQIDNDRLEASEEDRAKDRAARREETRRYHDRSDATRRRGQDVRDVTQRRGQDRRPATARRSGPARPTATGPNGQKVEWNGKAWVPVR